ncbi:zinc ABC transporter substrate-binding protein [Acerihabitans sp. KWT182]|uniref:Zinc ABC transporter substrate-binding protein n=1 Tax=Acerihabitans sp. KWT182 TaxID=3157919 RepID=A0AAU7QHS0_9GAMM
MFTVAIPCGGAFAADRDFVKAIGVENEYADVISQIGGKFVQVTALETDPNTDPHTFEASPKIAANIADTDLIVENGIGYDSWADRIISAAPNPDRKVINVQRLLGLPDNTPNPHLWYNPTTMPAVADAIASELASLMPARALYFQANLKKFDDSLAPWITAIAAFKKEHGNTPVAVTEPVADYLLDAAGIRIQTPYNLEAAVMNGTDPAPQDITAQNRLFNERQVKVFVYNQQVTDPLTQSFLALAKHNNIPVVGVYETMPAPGYHYQTWMLAEITALSKAVTDNVSTEALKAKL